MKFRLIVFYFIVCTLLAIFSACYKVPFIRERLIEEERERTARTEEAIKNSPLLQDLDRLCSEIPKPPNSQLINKRKSFNDKNYLTYGYYSDTPYSEMKGFYINHFEQNNWKMVEDSSGMTSQSIEFRKDSYDVSVTYSTRDEGLNYIFYCERLNSN